MSRVMSVEEDYGKPLSPKKLDEMIQRVSGWALLKGVQKKITATEFPERIEPMPFTMFPSILPADVLRKTKSLQTAFQTVIYKVANDHEFMKDCLTGLLEVDDFTKHLWDIYEAVRDEGPVQNVSMILTRNDYMMEYAEEGSVKQNCKQVEFNTFASGAGGVIGGMADVHRYSLNLEGIPYKDHQKLQANSMDTDKAAQMSRLIQADAQEDLSPYWLQTFSVGFLLLEDNYPTAGLARGMVKAHQLYGNKSAAILYIVGIPEPNTPDQRWLERDIFNLDISVKVIYRTFEQLIAESSVGENRELIVDGIEIAVVYYRYGYSPKHYPTDVEFKLRLDMERSRAIKCPTVAFHLAGCKKIQQVLAEPGVLERFIQGPDVIQQLRSAFVGLYKLDTEDSSGIIAQALQTPERFVLKPQREGGGNNLFGNELRDYLEKIKESPERSSWILMDRIRAARHRNRLIRVGLGPECRNVVSELGMFGVHISTPTEELDNYECGYLLRTKPEEANEAGLFSGQSCLDSPFLV